MTGARWGVIVPPSNPTAEHEIADFLHGAGRLYVARLDHQNEDLEHRLDGYRLAANLAVDRLRGLDLDAIGVACTGSSYPIGRQGDAAWARSLTAHAATPVVTAASSLIDAATDVRVRRIVLVSPYPDWLTASCRTFWEDAGWVVDGIVNLDAAGIYDATDDAMRKALDEAVDRSGWDTMVVVSGTGVPSAQLLDEVAPRSACPVISSNLAVARALAGADVSRSIGSSAMRSFEQWARARTPGDDR